MNKSKVLEYFDASHVVKGVINIIGCGAVGSHVAMALVQMGCDNIHLWDFDKVESKNITNQMFRQRDIGVEKVIAVEEMLREKNPQVKITLHKEGIKEPYVVNGYVFLCVDNIDLRREIVKANQYNPYCIAFFDFRMRLTDAQHYFAARSNQEQMKMLLSQMNFTHEEAKEATPQSACGVDLSVIFTVINIVSLGVANFASFCLGLPTKTMIISDMSAFDLLTYPMD